MRMHHHKNEKKTQNASSNQTLNQILQYFCSKYTHRSSLRVVLTLLIINSFHFVSASHCGFQPVSASSSTLWADSIQPSCFVNRHVSNMSFTVGCCLHSQLAALARPRLQTCETRTLTNLHCVSKNVSPYFHDTV